MTRCLMCERNAEVSPVYRDRAVAYFVRARGKSAKDRPACRTHLASVVDFCSTPGRTVDVRRPTAEELA